MNLLAETVCSVWKTIRIAGDDYTLSLSLTNKERMKDITGSIERGIEKYSVNNTMLIYMHKPNAALVAGFNK